MWKLCDVSERICSFWGFLRCSCMKYYLYCFYSFVFLQSKFICGVKGLFSHMRHPAKKFSKPFWPSFKDILPLYALWISTNFMIVVFAYFRYSLLLLFSCILAFDRNLISLFIRRRTWSKKGDWVDFSWAFSKRKRCHIWLN